MYNFKEQIDSDINDYQKKYSYYPNIKKAEWAFNFWVLYNLFMEDESVIGSKIIDYNDMGIDAYEIYEETNDVYLIQNKYYSDDTMISTQYIRDDFLIRGITALENGNYKHCRELQKYFTKNKNKQDFHVYLNIYVTNNLKNMKAEEIVKEWNYNHPHYQTQIFYLEDIHNKYFNEDIRRTKNWETRIATINKGTVLNINSEAYKLQNIVDTRYVFTPVQSLFEMYKKARTDGYPIFDENIREYLGNKGVNKGIYTTLLDEDERKNFFYYNNGITIICDSMEKIETGVISPTMKASFKIKNPQIVNGCQTVNSIYQALDNVDDLKISQMFADTFVMTKILQIDKTENAQQELYKKVVKYNNSQNSIDEKTFVRNTAIFNRIQKSFLDKGFVVLIKQSDKYLFTEKCKENSAESLQFIQLSDLALQKFGIDTTNKLKIIMVDLSKLLQVILAFESGGQAAYNKKPNVLKYGTQEYKTVTEFVQNNTIDTLLHLYLLFLRLEQARNNSQNGRTPIVYYALDIFGRHICDRNNSNTIIENLKDSAQINAFVKLVSKITKNYLRKKQKIEEDLDYNHLIKLPIDYSLLDECYIDCLDD